MNDNLKWLLLAGAALLVFLVFWPKKENPQANQSGTPGPGGSSVVPGNGSNPAVGVNTPTPSSGNSSVSVMPLAATKYAFPFETYSVTAMFDRNNTLMGFKASFDPNTFITEGPVFDAYLAALIQAQSA